jgi:hypothetical protein
MLSVLYSVIRLLVDVVTTMRRDQAELAAEVLTLRRQVQVLERQIKRVHWTPGDRMVMAVQARLLPKSAWKGLLVKPETVLGWHRDLVRRKLGLLPRPTTPRQTSPVGRGSSPDRETSDREPWLGLLPNQGRTHEARPQGGGNNDPIGTHSPSAG